MSKCVCVCVWEECLMGSRFRQTVFVVLKNDVIFKVQSETDSSVYNEHMIRFIF